jgi:hypothetical protein
MRIASNCTALAAALSLAYRTHEDFQPATETLEEFLDHNGVLLTMCMRFRGTIPWMECSRDKNDSKLSASWVQRDKTKGLHVIGKPIDIGPPVGLVLKPTSTKIRCVFPADAATDGRDDQGCGPMSSDPQHGSKGYDHVGWIEKQVFRQQIISYKNYKWGASRIFASIPCKYFLDRDDTNVTLPLVGFVNETPNHVRKKHRRPGQWILQSDSELIIDQWFYIMGKDVCNKSQPVPKPDLGRDNYLIYQGVQSWNPQEWTESMEMMQQVLQLVPPSVHVWNELVVEVPTAPSEAEFANHTVQAVFYLKGNGVVVDEIARWIAKRESQKMNKPLMFIDLQNLSDESNDFFHCISDSLDTDEALL